MSSIFSAIIADMQQKGLYNNMRTIQSEQGAYLKIGGKKYLNMGSNNYLGLAAEPRLKKAVIAAIKKYGVGTASVRSLVGTNDLHLELESRVAKFKHADDAIVLTSGYLANMAAIQTILEKEDVVISDELNHASIIDAVRLAGVQNKFIYKHADVADLRRQFPEIKKLLATKKSNSQKRRVLIVTDGVFSMDGDLAPLKELVKAKKEIGALLMVDDAHGEGVMGPGGRGTPHHFKVEKDVDITVGTFSKAFGVVGGFISGDKDLLAFYHQKARQFLFTNALSIPDTAALIEATKILQQSDARVKKLWVNAAYLKKELKKAGFNTGVAVSPITPVMLGDENLAKDFVSKLFERGVLATAIKFPMVALGKARIRLIPSAAHSKKDLAFGVKQIVAIGKELGVV